MSTSQQNHYTHDEVLRIADGEVFGPGAPKLPQSPMLMVDRITRVTTDGGTHGNGYVEAELDIHPKLWFFQCHFKNDPVMPGCLGLDAMWQLTGFFLAWSGRSGRGRALGVKELKFTGQVLPENKLVTYRINIRRVIDRKLVLVVSDGSMLVDGEQIYAANDLRVGLFND